MTTLRQWSTRLSARSIESLTTERSLAIGTILETPSSVAFCRVVSIRSPLDTHWASAMARGDSRSGVRIDITQARTSLRETRISSAENSPPSPLNKMTASPRSEEHTSELQSPDHLVCRLLLEKKKHNTRHDS